MIDAHAHLDKYGDALPRALGEIRTRGIRTIAVSMDVESFRTTQGIAEAEPLVLPSFGVHPWDAPRFASDLSALDAPLQEARLLGEVGLDRYFVTDPTAYPAQEKVFEYFLDAAEGSGRLINVHTTGAESRVLQMLRGFDLPSVVVHWYSGPLDLVDAYLALGVYFTVGVELMRSDTIRSLLAKLPADRILTETDNPGGWEWMTGETGFPRLIEDVEREAARIRGVSRVAFGELVQENFERVLAAGGIGR
jgi:TatD DNase family protein